MYSTATPAKDCCIFAFFRPFSSFSYVNCSNSLSNRLFIIFWQIYQWFQEGFRVDWNVLSTSDIFCLAAFNLTFEGIFLPFTSFIVLHTILIAYLRLIFFNLLIWPRMYSCYSFSYVLVLSERSCLCASKDPFFSCYLVFSFTSIDLHGILYLVLALVGLHLTAASIWAVTRFPTLLQMLPEEYHTCLFQLQYFMFHNFFSSRARSKYLSIFLRSFIFSLIFFGISKSTGWHFLVWLWVSFNWFILVCICTICQYCQILISCTIPNGSSLPPSHA